MLFKSVPVTTMSRSTSDSMKISRPAVLSWMSQCPVLQPLIISSRDTCPSAKDKNYTTSLRTIHFQQRDRRLRYTEILSVPGLRIFEPYHLSLYPWYRSYNKLRLLRHYYTWKLGIKCWYKNALEFVKTETVPVVPVINVKQGGAMVVRPDP